MTHGHSAADVLVDSRTGVVKRLVRLDARPGIPRSYVTWAAELGDSERFATWRAQRFAYGAALGDDARARGAAIGEAVERYCGNAVPDRLLHASRADLAAGGMKTLDPRELALYSEAQYRARGFPFVPLSDDLVIGWVEAACERTGEPRLVPASLVYLNYHRGRRAAEPATNQLVYAGIAAGASPGRARRAAFEELVERDAVTIWWQSRAPAARIRLESCPDLTSLLADRETADALRWSLWWIPSTCRPPVVGALVEDRARALLAFGSACRPTPRAAAAKAVTEAIQILTLQHDLVDAESDLWQAAELGLSEPTTYRPFRADRRYLDDFRPDRRDLDDLGRHAQLHLDPRMQRRCLRRFDGARPGVDIDEIPPVLDVDPWPAYLADLAAQGLDALTIDLTTPDVQAAGLAVVRVLVPGLYANAPAAFPYLGGRRLYEVPPARGWAARAISEADLELDPLPFA